MAFFAFLSDLLNLYGDFKKSAHDDISEQQKYNNKQRLMNKKFKSIYLMNKRNEIQHAWADMDKTLAPVASIYFDLPDFYPPEDTLSNFYKCFSTKENMSIGRKYADKTRQCLSQLLLDRTANDFIIHDNQSIEESLEGCINNLSFLWHVLDGQFKQLKLKEEADRKDKSGVQAASRILYGHAKSLDKHIGQLNNNFSEFIKSTK